MTTAIYSKSSRGNYNNSKHEVSWIHRVEQFHNNKYDYSKFMYVNAITKGEIICPIHGSFLQSPSKHNHHGCRKCSGNAITTKGSVDRALIVDKIQIKRIGDVINAKTHIIWECLHTQCSHQWRSSPDNILNKGSGCTLCAGNKKLTNDIVDTRLQDQNKLIKRLSDYNGYDAPMDWVCLSCNSQYTTSANSVFKHNCPRCNTGGAPSSPSAPGFLYLLRLSSTTSNEIFLKIGITQFNIDRRIKALRREYLVERICVIPMLMGEAYEIEQRTIKSMSSSKFIPSRKFGGYTECFVDSPSVLEKIEDKIST